MRLSGKGIQKSTAKSKKLICSRNPDMILDLGFTPKRSNDSHSKKDTPIHSDDEVTPRRGLDEMMTESKLNGLRELDQSNEFGLASNKVSETDHQNVIYPQNT